MQTRVSITLNDKLLEEIDKRAGELCLSRSAFITTAVVAKLNADDLTKNLPLITAQMQQLQQKMESYESSVDGQMKWSASDASSDA